MRRLCFEIRLASFVCLLVLVGCQTAPSGRAASMEHFRGTLHSGCAPNDAPATVLDLRSTAGSGLASFTLWPSPPLRIPGEVRFDRLRGDGMATYCTKPDACQPAAWGEVHFSDSPGEAGIGGKWRLGMPDGNQVQGTFEADWLASQAICG